MHAGLDAASAFFCVSALKTLAEQGRSLVMSIHQPSAEIFDLFDHLLLLSRGEMIFFGLASQCVPPLLALHPDSFKAVCSRRHPLSNGRRAHQRQRMRDSLPHCAPSAIQAHTAAVVCSAPSISMSSLALINYGFVFLGLRSSTRDHVRLHSSPFCSRLRAVPSAGRPTSTPTQEYRARRTVPSPTTSSTA